jgi:CheY-like chemotaxis protein
MELDTISAEVIDHALRLYLSVAWPGQEEKRRPDLTIEGAGETALSGFTDESRRDGDRRWALRLGNSQYPHMKMVVEEYLLPGEYVFAVDTHDQLELKPDYPDYDKWQAVKETNRKIKVEIEECWRKEGIPTYSELAEKAARVKASNAVVGEGTRILVVDDEREIADAVASLLITEGFDVLLAHDGDEAVSTAVRERPDLILMDFQMPRLDGVQAAIRIRKTLKKPECRILLATAALMDLSAVAEADGFLLKPYSKEILFSFIHALLGQRTTGK